MSFCYVGRSCMERNPHRVSSHLLNIYLLYTHIFSLSSLHLRISYIIYNILNKWLFVNMHFSNFISTFLPSSHLNRGQILCFLYSHVTPYYLDYFESLQWRQFPTAKYITFDSSSRAFSTTNTKTAKCARFWATSILVSSSRPNSMRSILMCHSSVCFSVLKIAVFPTSFSFKVS